MLSERISRNRPKVIALPVMKRRVIQTTGKAGNRRIPLFFLPADQSHEGGNLFKTPIPAIFQWF